MKSSRLFASSFVALLLVTSVFAFTLQGLATASIIPQADSEYASGTISPENMPFKVWYSWVNIAGTQVIHYAAYTTPDYDYPVPIANILGQHFTLEDGTQFFIASALSELEVYSDLNDDGIPQNGEVLYYIYTNMSQSYSMTPIQKTTIESVPHYTWSFTYQNVYAYLQNANQRIGVTAKMLLEHLTLNYDFSVDGNVSDLKTSFDIGKVTDLEILDSSSGFSSFDGLSLALLYTTATYTSKSYSTSVNGQPYNSSTADSAVNAENAEVKVENTKAYDFIFGGNYTLYREDSTQTHEAVLETYEAQAQAVSTSGLPTRYGPTVRSISFFADQLNLSELFGGSWLGINAKYESSSLIYRICFPEWDGLQIEHDPTFLGYICATTEQIPEIPLTALLITPIIGISIALILQKRLKTVAKPTI